MLEGGETDAVDFKRHPDGLHAEDLVAFANTESGGDILIGVDKITSADGSQAGVPIGCDLSDKTLLQILNKASACIPPIALRLFAENLADKPILRLNIPRSESRPHCTPKGVYCRRDGSRIRPLHPTELLRVFLDSEGKVFAQRFEESASRITQSMVELEEGLGDRIDSMASELGWAESKVRSTEDTVDTILSYVQFLREEADDCAARLRTLFRQDKRDDPVRNKARDEVLVATIEQLNKKPNLVQSLLKGGKVTMSPSGRPARELDEADLQWVLEEAVKTIQPKLSLPTPIVVSPDEASEEQKAAFMALVRDAGEVADGLKARLARAAKLALLSTRDELAGTAAIKHPSASYRRKVFKNAKVDGADNFLHELGWVVIAKRWRGQHLTGTIVDAALRAIPGAAVFATTRSNNAAMHHVLEKRGFVRAGISYPSEQRPEQHIVLYVRAGTG